MMIGIPYHTKHNLVLKELDRAFKDPFARRALIGYWHTRTELLYFIVCCLQFLSDELSDYLPALGKKLLCELGHNNCSIYHFCKEWCRLANEDEQTQAIERRLRAELMEALFMDLPESCRHHAKGKLPRPSAPAHRCGEAEPAPAQRQPRTRRLARPELAA